ncbi:hypothetical protein C8J57DRAFT_1630867 [Mycena rebaudengoi]|nr:hypothetical protein C8J57DRAFT_1630867 [Mycena rebaudengoi]
MTTTATELRAQLAKIEEKTAALLAQLQLLGEQRQSVLQRLDAVVYPVLTLPSEITADIFVHYLGDFPVITYDYALKTYPPLLLAGVCREWRRVALSFPRLWATLSLKWNLRTVHYCEQLLKCWLLRAGGCLLDLDLSGSDLTESRSISAAVVQSTTIGEPFSSETAGVQLCFPALQTLTVDLAKLSNETAITAFGDAPRLREVCMSGGSASFINLPWNQLTRLDLENHVASALQVLKQTPNLEVLSFRMRSDPDDDPPPIIMKNLHTLRIDPSSSWGLLHFLTVPALKTLELGYPDDSDLDSLLSMVSRSSCAVQVMHLHDHTAGELMDSLRLFESLEHLTIQFGIPWVDRFWGTSRIDRFESEDEYCSSVFGFLKERGQLPVLKSLSLVDFPMAIDAALLTSMLDSRRQTHGVTNLESFKLVFEAPAKGYEEAHVSQLRALVDRGLNIHIEWPTRTGESSKYVNPEIVWFSVVLRFKNSLN